MDIITLALCKKIVKNAISAMGDVFDVKGKVATVQDLPKTGNKNGDLYLVGPKADGSYDEYFWSSLEKWELMGSTSPDIEGMITEQLLYAGEDGTGTVENPAEDTILAVVKNLSQEYSNSNFLSKTNSSQYTPTQEYHPATKQYVDNIATDIQSDISDVEESILLNII